MSTRLLGVGGNSLPIPCRPPGNGPARRIRQLELRIGGVCGQSGRWLPHSRIGSARQEGRRAGHSEETLPNERSQEPHGLSQPTSRPGKSDLGVRSTNKCIQNLVENMYILSFCGTRFPFKGVINIFCLDK
jgi:hypothetical protein